MGILPMTSPEPRVRPTESACIERRGVRGAAIPLDTPDTRYPRCLKTRGGYSRNRVGRFLPGPRSARVAYGVRLRYPAQPRAAVLHRYVFDRTAEGGRATYIDDT